MKQWMIILEMLFRLGVLQEVLKWLFGGNATENEERMATVVKAINDITEA